MSKAVLFAVALLIGAATSAFAQVSAVATRDLTLLGAFVQIDTTGMSVAAIQIGNTYVGTNTFEVTANLSTWETVDCAPPNDSGSPVNSTTTTGLWTCPVAGLRALRVRMTAFTSGTATVQLVAVATGGGSGGGGDTTTANNFLSLIKNASETTATAAAATALSVESLRADVATSNTTIRKISAGATEDEFEIKATAAVLMGFSCRNSHATTDAYFKLTNATAANTTPGSTAVVYDFLIPAGPSGNNRSNINATFSVAMTGYIVTGKTDADATEVAANDVSCTVEFR